MIAVEARELCKTYRQVKGGVQAVQGLSFAIKENTITGLIGRNGAGKTTLLKMIAGYLRPTGGMLRVFEREPFNDLSISANTIFVDDGMAFPASLTLADIVHGQSPVLGTRAYPNGIYQNSGQVFTLGRTKDTTLHFNITGNTGSYIILVQKKDMKQRKIEAATFVTTSEASGIDFTQRIAPPRISFGHGTLTVEPGLPQRLTYKVMQSPWVVKQFQERSTGNATNRSGLAYATNTLG
ncbi:Putative ABC transporter [Acididesulfobacillus acetoxydans]|uniref:ABC transporter n=1 Tax=Acididesulfobacillus acetoxydans TaxID=1561005 RepID=A0A8S0Y031_9FIRM|nr:ATP-binding cassette domain-containing protein [Acididesulfobacillus acetoxydans]CAA7602777.1 Putative ABC transporter [Acididesulfobacillus acetoxydans]CEJ06366.1 ABC transporter [Acididesulfobacillus acetoxydans]